MNLDLNNILRDWPHEPGRVQVRKIVGDDGAEKIQLRLDLGLIQMNVAGRPDGMRPHGFESLLAYHQHKAREAVRRGGGYVLSADDCGDLQQEGLQYYHRYVSLLQLEEFAAVVRDTERNLDLFEFVGGHAENAELVESFVQFRPYVLMINTRARASIELAQDNLAGALREIDEGRERILEAYRESGRDEEDAPEVTHLDDWLDELRSQAPLSKVERLHRELKDAIDREAYERAAELRDKIRACERRVAD